MKLFTVIAKKWFDKVNGNTYHSVRCIRHKDNKIVVGAFQYGYGDHYRQTALEVMFKAKWFKNFTRPVNLSGENKFKDACYTQDTLHLLEREKHYPIIWTVSSGLKRDCIANGVL